jgi:hypothetical protein
MDINGISFDVNDIIAFSSVHPTDTQTYSGRIKGFCTKEVARVYTDIAAYNVGTGLAQVLPEFDYVLVEHNDTIRAWHPSWMTGVSKPAHGNVNVTLYFTTEAERDEYLALIQSSGAQFVVNS